MPPTEHDLSNASAILLTAIVFGLIFYDARRDLFRLMTGRTATLLSIVIWLLFEAVRVPDDLKVFSQLEYDTGMALVTLAMGSFLIGYHRSNSRLFEDLGRRLVQIDSANTIWLLFLAGAAIGLAPMLYFTDFKVEVLFEGLLGGKSRFSGVLQRGRMGDLRAALLELQMFLWAVIPFAAVIVFTPQAKGYRRFVCFAFIFWMLLRANASGLRSSVIPIVLPVAAAIFWRSTLLWKKRLLVAGLPAAFVVGFFYAAYVVANRDQGTADLDKAAAAAKDYTGFEMFRELLYIVDVVPKEVDYQYGRSYANQVINPIPRYFWPSKPIWDAGILLAKAKGHVNDAGVAYMTNSPGFIGEAYLNFGLVGVGLVPLVAGYVVKAWDRLFLPSSYSFLVFVVYAGGIANIFASGRSISIATFYGMISLYVLLILIETFGSSSQRKVSGRPTASSTEVVR